LNLELDILKVIFSPKMTKIWCKNEQSFEKSIFLFFTKKSVHQELK